MLVSTLIGSSLRKLGVYASGETPDASELADGLSALQSMLRSWAALNINVFATVKETKTLTPAKYLYTWGTGGDITTARPHQIAGAYILESGGVSHPVDLISESQYRNTVVKGTVSRPYALFFHPSFPLAEIYLYPVPSDAEVLYLDSWKSFTETSSFSSTSDTLAFPLHYEEPLIYNLAVRLAPEFGKTLAPEVAAIAVSSYERLVILNAANQVEPVFILVPASAPYGARYSINSDTNH
jgi:hypothetical protein